MYIPKLNHYKVKINDFSCAPDARVNDSLRPSAASVSYNFSLKDGALKDGEGVEVLKINGVECKVPTLKPLKLYYYHRYDNDNQTSDDRIMAYCSDGRVYQKKLSDNSGFSMVAIGSTLAGAPEGVNYKFNGEDVFIFSYGGTLYLYNGTTVTSYAAPDITSMCIYNERLFVTTGGEATTLWFSENFDPTNWYVSLSEAGFIDFQDGKGKLLKVVEHDGYAYVFRSYGITRVYAPYEQGEFMSANVEADKVRIYGGSVVSCGKKIIYLTENGFYSFDGAYSNKIASALDGFLRGADNDGVKAAFYKGRYYAILNVIIKGELESVLLSMDVNTGEYYFIKGVSVVDIIGVYEDEGRLLLLLDNEKGVYTLIPDSTFSGVHAVKIWRSAFSNFGIEGYKTLAKISLRTKSDIKMNVASDNEEREFTVYGGKGVKSRAVGIRGENFSVGIKSDFGDAEISNLTLDFTRLK